MLDELLEDPVGIGQQWAILVQRRCDVQATKLGDYSKANPSVALNEVDPTVAYFATAATNEWGDLEVSVYDEAVEDSVPIYYLPWNEHQVYKVRLASTRSPYPRLFFTDNLNGCAIVAEGITLMPSVYHANALKTLANCSPVADGSLVEKLALSVIDERNDVMFGACRAYPEDLSRKFMFSGRKWDLVSPAGAVTPREYSVLIGRPSENAEKKAAATNPTLRRLLGTVSPVFTQSLGTVFGVSDEDGNWRLFVQKIVSTKTRDVVLRCAEFWPGGFARLPW